MNDIELLVHRKGTEQFIAKDQTDIILIPSVISESFGTKTISEGTPRASQSFKFIYPAGDAGGGIVPTSGQGITHKFDFTIVGLYDAIVSIGDHWKEGNQFYQIEWVQPFNGYEVKAGGISYGSTPDHG